MAKVLGISQDGVSRLEKRIDLLLSTLRKSVEAMGGNLSLVAEFPDRDSSGAVRTLGTLRMSKFQREPLKQMRVVALSKLMVWTATRISLSGSKNNITLLSMKDDRFSVASFDSKLFDPTQLPSLTEKLGVSGLTKASGVCQHLIHRQ
jgi:hypothetical protein